MNRNWLKNYPMGVPSEIDPGQYDSLVQLLEEAFARFRDRPAYIGFGKPMSYGELDDRSRELGAFLQAQGVETGDRVAIMMPNVLQFPVVLAAILRIGAVVVNVNPLYTARELEHQLKDSGARAIVILENFAVTLQQVIARTDIKQVILASMGDLLGFKGTIVNFVVRRIKKLVPDFSLPGAHRFNDALNQGSSLSFTSPALHHADVAFLQYTGGTTGLSKGAT
ncbi:MAG: long-chain fatty acid--CoA ligase, partial [Betaproteobacteria bacterium]|nr:long-chain fatty acid--CoA ligase [Betaproteobacteria bacterium]